MKSRLCRWFNNLKLEWKFFSVLLLASLLVFAGTQATTGLAHRAYDNALYESTIQLLNLFAQNVQGELDKVVDTSFNILADNVFQQELTRMHRSKYGSQPWLEARRGIRNRLTSLSLLSGDIISIRLRSEDGTDFSRSLAARSIPAALMDKYQDTARSAQGSERWVSDPSTPGSIYLVRDVREIAELTLDSIAMMALEVDMASVVKQSSSTLSAMNMPLLCAIDLNGDRVYASRDDLPDLSGLAERFVLHKVDGSTFFCVRYAPEGSAWAYTAAMSYDNIMNSIRFASGLATGIALLAFTLALALGSLLTSSILRHFRRLSQKYEAFARGSWQPGADLDLYANRHDEIAELHRQFDTMAMEHQRMIDDIYVKQQLLLEAQLRQLRAQIRPHFLYNTLESIYCLAEKNGDERIATMTNSLGQMLRKTLQDKRDMISVRDDIGIARDYLNIQLIRYGDQLRVEFDVEDAFMGNAIPAMTLQPLVENAVLHGAEEMLEECRIRVSAKKAGPYIDLTVEDNGPGMPEDTLEKLESGEMKPEGLGIGLSNIHKRLRLAFKDEACGLRIRRENNRTQVIVRVREEKIC